MSVSPRGLFFFLGTICESSTFFFMVDELKHRLWFYGNSVIQLYLVERKSCMLIASNANTSIACRQKATYYVSSMPIINTVHINTRRVNKLKLYGKWKMDRYACAYLIPHDYSRDPHPTWDMHVHILFHMIVVDA